MDQLSKVHEEIAVLLVKFPHGLAVAELFENVQVSYPNLDLKDLTQHLKNKMCLSLPEKIIFHRGFSYLNPRVLKNPVDVHKSLLDILRSHCNE